MRELLGDLAGLADDKTLDAAKLRSRLNALIAPFEPEREMAQVSAIRQELGHKSRDLARLLRIVRSQALAVPADHRLTDAFAALGAVALRNRSVSVAHRSQHGRLFNSRHGVAGGRR